MTDKDTNKVERKEEAALVTKTHMHDIASSCLRFPHVSAFASGCFTGLYTLLFASPCRYLCLTVFFADFFLCTLSFP